MVCVNIFLVTKYLVMADSFLVIRCVLAQNMLLRQAILRSHPSVPWTCSIHLSLPVLCGRALEGMCRKMGMFSHAEIRLFCSDHFMCRSKSSVQF